VTLVSQLIIVNHIVSLALFRGVCFKSYLEIPRNMIA